MSGRSVTATADVPRRDEFDLSSQNTQSPRVTDTAWDATASNKVGGRDLDAPEGRHSPKEGIPLRTLQAMDDEKPPLPYTNDPVRTFSKEELEDSTPPINTPVPEEPVTDSTNPFPPFPPLPAYGSPSLKQNLIYRAFAASSLFFTIIGLIVLFIAATFKFSAHGTRYVSARLTCRDPDAHRPFIEEERRRQKVRREEAKAWKAKKSGSSSPNHMPSTGIDDGFIPTEGGHDSLTRNVGYYARRVGLDAEFLKVQTEDGFILDLWHIYDPTEYTPMTAQERESRRSSPAADRAPRQLHPDKKPKYPVLMMHGLLQSSGAYCTTDDSSLAFYLCKSGYDIWLGHNRCGFDPEHVTFKRSDPRFWAWNIRHMGTLDLPALSSRVLAETGFSKLALVGHSQGTTQTFIAMSRMHNSSHNLNSHLSIFCALAPAVYGGTWLRRPYFAFVNKLHPSVYNLFFGTGAFIPAMMKVCGAVPSPIYGWSGYWIFNYLFNWTDTRWDRGTRNRCFLFAPVYVSAESMRWWLGADGFASHGCILATREETLKEDEESSQLEPWYDESCPPIALWIPGSDELVDGRKLLRRLEKREPHVRLVHSKVIEEYEHLDVIWAMDSIEKVGKEVRDCIWRSIDADVRATVQVVKGCEGT